MSGFLLKSVMDAGLILSQLSFGNVQNQ